MNMKQIYAFLLICGVVLTGAQFSGARAEGEPQVYISEINWAGGELSASDEWIELYNRSGEEVAIGGWILTASATGGEELIVPDGFSVDAESTFLIANYSDSDERSTLSAEPDYVTSALSLSNSNLAIELKNGSEIVDSADLGSGNPDFGSRDPIASAVRSNDFGWQTADESLNLNGAQHGTPGAHGEAFDFDTLPEEDQVTHCQSIIADFEAASVDDEPEAEETDGNETSADEESQNETDAEETEVPCTCETSSDNDSSNAGHSELDSESSDQESSDETVNGDNSDEDTSTQTEDQADSTFIPSTGTIVINELVSDPEDGNEWVELWNTGDTDVSLDGWSLEDAAGGSTALNGVIEADGFALIENPKGKLNNSGDSLYLYDPENAHNSMSYGVENKPAPDKGESLGRYSAAWFVYENPSPGAANVAPAVGGNDPDASEADNEADTETDVASPEAESANEAEPEPEVVANEEESSGATEDDEDTGDVMTATITAEPGLFGSQIAYAPGRQLYMHSGDWPSLEAGDRVRMEGEFSVAYGEERLKIASADDITVLSQETVEPAMLSPGAADQAEPGTLATVTGLAAVATTNELALEANDAGIAVVAHSDLGMSLTPLEGEQLSVTGIIRHRNGEVRLYPRYESDIVVLEANEEESSEEVPVIAGTGEMIPPKSGSGAPWGGISLLTFSGGLGAYWLARHYNLLQTLTA
jgi:hypothetical protein